MAGAIDPNRVGLIDAVVEQFGVDARALINVLGLSTAALGEIALVYDEATDSATLTQLYPNKPVNIVPGTLRNWVPGDF